MQIYQKCLCFLLIFAAILTACDGSQVNPIRSSEIENDQIPLTQTPDIISQKQSRKQIILPVGFAPSIQLAPLYLSISAGYFRQRGLDVVINYGFESEAVAQVGKNELQFAIASSETVLLARAQGLPVVYVMAWYQRYPVSVVAKKELEINTPQELANKHIGIPGLYGANYVGLQALLKEGDVKESDITLDSIGYTQLDALRSDRVQAVIASTSEALYIQSLVPVTNLPVARYSQLASYGLVTNETTLNENPELVQNMVDAFLEGLAHTIDNAPDGYRAALRNIKTLDQESLDTQNFILDTSINQWQAERIGYSDPIGWENMQKLLLEIGLLEEPLDLNKAYTNQFIN